MSLFRAKITPQLWLAVLAPLSLLTGCGDKPAAAPPPPAPPSVEFITLHSKPVTMTSELPGRVSAFRVAEVRPQVSGLVKKRLFTEGRLVTAGQPLYQLDPAPYQASLASAEATLARAEAAVISDQATVSRYRPLTAINAVSRQDLDTAIATLRQAEADVASAKASIKTATINLNYTDLSAPIAGRTSRSSVTEGALVTADQTTSLVTVTQLNPIYIDVTQPSGTLLRLKRELANGQLTAAGEGQAQVTLTLEDGSTYEQPGRLQFSEVTVDQTTGSVTLRAIFPNDHELLLPGMFVRETIAEGVRQNALLVPQRGVTHNPQGQPVAMVVSSDNKAEQRVLTVDRTIGDNWLVTSGLADGDKLIVSGLQNIRPGVPVTAHEAASPAPAAGQTTP